MLISRMWPVVRRLGAAARGCVSTLCCGLVALLLVTPCQAEVGGLQALPERILRPNVAGNSSFETGSGGPESWSLGSWTWASGACRTGGRCLALSDQGSSYASAILTLRNIDFRSAHLRAWIRTTGAGFTKDSAFTIGLDCATDRNYSIASGHVGTPLNLGGERPEWTQYTLADNITWSSIHYGHDLRIKIHARNIPAAATLYVDDVTVEPVLVPLTIFPLYPNYRGMLWADQGTVLRWRAIVEPPPGYAIEQLKVSTEILDSAGGLVRPPVNSGPLNAVDTRGGLGARWPGASLNTQSFDALELPSGVYYLRGKLIDASTGKVLYTYPDYKIVKEAPSVQRDSWKVWVDRYNRAVIEGVPRFIWGGFLQPNFAANTYSNGRGDPYTSAEPYGTIAISQPPFGPGTMLGVMADLNMNADIYFGNLAGANIGIVNRTGAIGTITSQGTRVSGSGARFTSQLKPGDTIQVSGFTAAGTASGYGERLVGKETSFTTQLRTFDRITVAGQSAMVARVVSDRELELQTGLRDGVSDAAITYESYRTVTNVLNDNQLEIDAPFSPDVNSPQSFRRNLCSGWYPSYSQLMPYLSAAQQYGIWHLHITVSYNPSSANNPTWASVCRLDSAAAVQKLLTHPHGDDGILGNRAGWLGTYIADEPPPNNSEKGLLASFAKARAAMDAREPGTGKSLGGINYWVDGLMPLQTWNQWGNFMDAGGPDPYPVGFGVLADDVVYGISSGRVHGRSYWWPRQVADGQLDSRPLWTTIQLFRASVSAGLPNRADQKIQLVSALAAGSTGIFWWTVAGNTGLGSLADEAYYQGWRESGKVIASLLPILSQPVQDLADRLDDADSYGRLIASVSDPAIKCASWKSEDRVLLACANTTNHPINATISMTKPIAGDLTLPWDGSTIKPDGDRFTVRFARLQDETSPENSVHLFLLKF